MKKLDGKIWLSFDELLDAGIPKLTAKDYSSNQSWETRKSIEDARKVLILADSIRGIQKERVVAKYGDDLEGYYNEWEVIRGNLMSRDRDVDVLRAYRYEDKKGVHKHLPSGNLAAYIEACKYLWLLERTTLKEIKGLGMRGKGVFWGAALKVIGVEGVVLPKNMRRLQGKVKDYRDKGAVCVVNGRFGNNNSMKVGRGDDGAVQVAFLQELLAAHVSWDAAKIARKYNKVAVERGWKKVSGRTVLGYKTTWEGVVKAGRDGARAYRLSLGKLHKRVRPSKAGLYYTLDGWVVELYYKGKRKRKSGQVTTYDNRLVVVVVLDAFNDFPVGYAIGKQENVELIKEGLRDAIRMNKKVTGEYRGAHQVQSDRYGLKALTPFYEGVTRAFTPAAVGNANAKVVEPYFRYLNREYCQEWENWSGHNIDAKKENQPNREYMELVKKEFPDLEGVTGQVHQMMADERRKKGAKWLASMKAGNDKMRVMTRAEFLEVCGRVNTFKKGRKVLPYQYKIGGYGLSLTIDGEVRHFDTFDVSFRGLSHLRWVVYFDDKDLGSVLAVAGDGRFKYVLEAGGVTHMAIADRLDGELGMLDDVRGFNKGLIDGVTKRRTENAELLGGNGLLEASKPKRWLADSKGQWKDWIQEGLSEDVAGVIDVPPVPVIDDGVDDELDVMDLI